MYYRSLALLLGVDQPVYGLQSALADGGWRAESVEGIAANFVAEMRAFQPHGPYRIAGHSFGGFVALEMARLLTVEGEQVELLALFDTMPPHAAQTPKPAGKMLLHTFDRVRYHLESLAKLDNAGRRKYLAEFLRFQSFHRARSPLGKLAKKVGGVVYEDSNSDRVLAAMSKYEPAPYNIDVTVFKVVEHAWLRRWDPMDDWVNYVHGKLTVFTVPGDHVNLLDDQFVGEVARLLKTCLDGQA